MSDTFNSPSQRWARDRMFYRQEIDDLKTRNKNQAATIISQAKLIDELQAKSVKQIQAEGIEEMLDKCFIYTDKIVGDCLTHKEAKAYANKLRREAKDE